MNGAIPALLVGSGDNNDIKLPIRLPISNATHEAECKADCVQTFRHAETVDAMEASQAATVGYHCDYSNKRQPCGVHECKEWCKGHGTLENKVRRESLGYQARRHAQRLVSDCFCRGILRVPNETCKLNDNVLHSEPTAAEVLTLAPYKTIPGPTYMYSYAHARLCFFGCECV